MKSIISQFELQTLLFNNCTTGFSESDSEKLAGDANHVKWLTGHTASSRYLMANLINLHEQEPYPDLFADLKGRDDNTKYPSMNDLTKDWNGLSEKIIHRLKQMSDADFDAPEPFQVPTSDGTMRGVLTFFAHHEAYTIGQIAYARRIYGLEPMKYN